MSGLYLGAYEHGRPSTYNRGCRCSECRLIEAQRATRKRKSNSKRLRRGEAQINHGRSGYTNWGCRCEICTIANTEACRPTSSRWRKANPQRSTQLNQAIQNATLQGAVRHGQMWTGPELELAGRQDLTAKQIALMLGRSYWAVIAVRRKLRDDPSTAKVAGIPRRGGKR